MDNFFKIRAEKQAHIINAGLTVFGKQGYRKASMADIAKEADTTKGMITYYFGSKKTLYLYLIENTQEIFNHEVKRRIGSQPNDFFKTFRVLISIQSDTVKEHPAYFVFANSIYYENDPEVLEDIRQIATNNQAFFDQLVLNNAGLSKLDPDIDPQVLLKLLSWANDGFVTELYDKGFEHIDALVADCYKALDMLEQAFYK